MKNWIIGIAFLDQLAPSHWPTEASGIEWAASDRADLDIDG